MSRAAHLSSDGRKREAQAAILRIAVREWIEKQKRFKKILKMDKKSLEDLAEEGKFGVENKAAWEEYKAKLGSGKPRLSFAEWYMVEVIMTLEELLKDYGDSVLSGYLAYQEEKGADIRGGLTFYLARAVMDSKIKREVKREPVLWAENDEAILLRSFIDGVPWVKEEREDAPAQRENQRENQGKEIHDDEYSYECGIA